MAKNYAAAARTEVLERLAKYRETRAGLHGDVRRAAELGISTAEIARTSGLSWPGVKKILDRKEG